MTETEYTLLMSRNAQEDEADDTDLKTVVNTGGDTCEFPEHIPAAWPLPSNKKHHLFISYSSKDYDIVKDLIAILEDRYQLKCAFSERDFIPGKTTRENIIDTMRASIKILLCITPNYLESGWCDYEHDIAFVMSREERKNCVIPLLLEPCKNIPPGLETIHYIDAKKSHNIPERIVAAFNHICTPDCCVPNRMSLYHHNNANVIEETQTIVRKQNGMNLLRIQAVEDVQGSTFSNVWKFKSLSESQKQQLKSDEVEVAILLYMKLLKEVNKANILQHYGVLSKARYLVIFFVLSVVISLSITIDFFLFEIIQLKTVAIDTGIFVILWIILTCGGFAVVFFGRQAIRREMAFKFRKSLWNLQRKYYKKSKVIFLYRDDSNKVPFIRMYIMKFALTVYKLEIMRYDTEPCKVSLQTMLKEQIQDLTDSKIEELVDKLIENKICERLNDLLHWVKLQDCEVYKHSTFLRKQCLCQMIEQDISASKLEEIVKI